MLGNYFFAAILGIYVSINGYMFARLFTTLAGTGFLRGLTSAVFLVFAASFPAGRILQRALSARASDFLYIMGSLYLAPMIYGFLLTLAADLFRILNYHVTITANPPPYSASVREGAVAAIVALSAAISMGGAINAMFPAAVFHDVEWSAPASAPSIRIALVSDLHIGKFVGASRLRRVVGLINAQSPDIVLIAGDAVDDDSVLRSGRRRDETAAIFKSMRPRLGVWAVPGNHEYYAGIGESVRFLEDCGVGVLRDAWATPGGEFLLIGRDDLTVRRAGGDRASLRAIISEAEKELGPGAGGLPILVMDHQPFNLEESQDAGVALQLSGHTHRGQLFPINFIVSWIYEKHYGLYKKGNSQYYISSGAGAWGPPVRTIGRPEVVFLNLKTR
jgi:predicted MPP superfamily phosphohydrolase